MNRSFLTTFIAAAIVVGLWLWPHPAQAQSTSTFLPVLNNGDPLLCRFGINGTPQPYPIRPLRIGWYLDYQASRDPNPPGSMDYYPMLRFEQIGADGYAYSIFGESLAPTTEAQLLAVIDNNPGTYWFLGNEPDRIQYQDHMEPRAYARAYHDLYQLIKQRDPAAKIVAGAIVQATPVRLQYLDLVLQNYFDLYGEKMPVDVWAIHNFILNEASCNYYAQFYPNDPIGLESACWGADIPPGVNATDGLRIDVQDNDDIKLFKQQVVAFRQWMADNGYRDVPLFLSEFGVLMPQGYYSPDFSPARVNAFMTETFDYLRTATDPTTGYPGDHNRLVQRFAWYSVAEKDVTNGYLFDRDRPAGASRTAMGDNFASYTARIDEEVDLYPTSVTIVGSLPTTLQAKIHNAGNVELPTGAVVRFFNGNPAAGGTQIGSDQAIQLAGCGEFAEVTVEWDGVTPGSYEVYVQVTTDAVELDTGNNTMHETVNVGSARASAIGANIPQ